MKGGRRNLKRAAAEVHNLTLQHGQSIMQVASLRGSNLIEVMDAKGQNSLALFPAKFQKSIWIKRGSFVVADESGKEKALESGSKVACIVSQVLFYEQVRTLQKSPEWSERFKYRGFDDFNGNLVRNTSKEEDNEREFSGDGDGDGDDDGFPSLEANTNRTKPAELELETGSNSESDRDS